MAGSVASGVPRLGNLIVGCDVVCYPGMDVGSGCGEVIREELGGEGNGDASVRFCGLRCCCCDSQAG